MKLLIKINDSNYNLVKIGFFIIWISIISSINTSPLEILLINHSIVKTFNAIRILSALILSFIITVYFIYIIFKKKIIRFRKIYFIWIAYFFIQIISGFINGDEIITSNQLNEEFIFFIQEYWQFKLHIHIPILGIATIIFLLLVDQKKIQLEYFLNILIIIITLASIVLLILTFIKNTTFNFNLYYMIDPDYRNTILNQPFPRITGLSRMLAIMNITIILIFLLKKIKTYNKLFLYLLIILISIIINNSQSRGTFLCFYLSIIFIIFFLLKKKLEKKVKMIIILILFPILLTYLINSMIAKTISLDAKEHTPKPYVENTRYLQLTDSGRIELWKRALTNYDFRNLLGLGPQADRRLLLIDNYTLEKSAFGNNVSNGFIYALLCGGYLSLICYLIINFKIIINIIKNITMINNYKNNFRTFYYKLSSVFLFFFFIRQFFENSFSIFSIDFLVIIICSLIIDKDKGKNFKQN